MSKYLDFLRKEAEKICSSLEKDERLTNFSNELGATFKTINKSLCTLKDKVNSMLAVTKIEIPYNRETEKLSYTVEGNKVIFETKSLDGGDTEKFYREVRTLPDTVDMSTMVHTYDKENKVMVFRFKNSFVATEAEEGEIFPFVESSHFDEDGSDEADEFFESEEDKDYTNNLGLGAIDGEEEPTDAKDTARQLREQGWSYRRIGREVGVSDKTVARWLKND